MRMLLSLKTYKIDFLYKLRETKAKEISLHRIYFNFYNINIQVDSDCEVVLQFLEKHFSVFKSVATNNKIDFSLQVFQKDPPYELIPKIVSSMQTLNSVCYDHDGIRYCDYYGDLLVILNLKLNSANLYSQNISKIHEVCYLLLLSRVGKKMDLMGLHKLHAFSVSYKDLAVVCMMPMKGGKSTLLMEFLSDQRFKIISDDIPLINIHGEILPFPLKIGLSQVPLNLKVLNPETNYYFMERAQYGKKQLLSLEGLPGRIESIDKIFSKIILIEAFRYHSPTSKLSNSGYFKTGKGLIKHGVVGFGLPMVIEYFWEVGIEDFLLKMKILLSRLIAFSGLLVRSKKLKLFLGNNPSEAAELIKKYVIENYNEI